MGANLRRNYRPTKRSKIKLILRTQRHAFKNRRIHIKRSTFKTLRRVKHNYRPSRWRLNNNRCLTPSHIRKTQTSVASCRKSLDYYAGFPT